MINPELPRDLLFTAALFGFVSFVWTGWAQERPPSTVWRVVLAVLGLAGAALAGVTVPRLVRAWSEPTAMVVGSLAWTVYLIVFAIEVVAIVVGAILLTRSGRSAEIAPLVLLVVGVHFAPLAWVFAQPILLVAAALISAAAVASWALPRTRCAPSFWCGILSGPIFVTLGAICAFAV